MNPAKAWAMMNARGAQLISARGGTPELTAADIARGLQGLPRGPFRAGMVKEMGDQCSLVPLETLLTAASIEQAHQEKWLADDAEYCRDVCRRFSGLAVLEFLLPRPEACENCHGRGYITVDGNGVQCAYCHNSGGEILSARRRAELTGIAETSWRRVWSARYEEVHLTVNDWHSRALRHLRKAISAMSAEA